MHPVICTLGPVTIYSYGLMVALAFLVCVSLARQHARRVGIDPEVIINACFLGLAFGIAGARFLYVIEHWAQYRNHPWEVLMLQHGGLSFFGGLLAGVAAALVYLRRRKQSLYRIFDLLAPYIALGHAIGRIGCFFNGCCFGKVSVWGVYFPVLESTRIPTQLISSAALIGIYLVLRILQERFKSLPAGTVFYVYLALYAGKRFGIEFLRDDNYPFFAGLTFFQVFSAAAGIFALVQLARRMPRPRSG
jgi:phosphatidylglycerol---prolipoprotein diacylglyceryl transferase